MSHPPTSAVQVTDPEEIQAVKAAIIEGYCYRDGEVYGDARQVERWRFWHDNPTKRAP
jgi:hypothetical protein